MPQGLLTRTEVVNYLGCDSKTLASLINKKQLTLYKVGGQYERFNKDEVVRLKLSGLKAKPKRTSGRGAGDKVLDFWRYNNFYIVTVLILAAVVYYFFFR